MKSSPSEFFFMCSFPHFLCVRAQLVTQSIKCSLPHFPLILDLIICLCSYSRRNFFSQIQTRMNIQMNIMRGREKTNWISSIFVCLRLLDFTLVYALHQQAFIPQKFFPLSELFQLQQQCKIYIIIKIKGIFSTSDNFRLQDTALIL